MRALTEKVFGKIQRSREMVMRLNSPTLASSITGFVPLLQSQQTYIWWHSIFLLLQCVEILILAAVHRVYFPPASLLILRLISSWSLIATIVSLIIRFNESNKFKTIHEKFTFDGFRTARLLFQTSVIVALIALSATAYKGGLHMSTPPIFRAVVYSFFLTLPFDVLSTFIFLNPKMFRQVIPRRNYRMMVLFGDVCSVLCVYFNIPLLCIFCRVIPHIFLGTIIWLSSTGLHLMNLLSMNLFVDFRERRQAKELLTRISPTIVLPILLELSLYSSFACMRSLNDSMAVMIFFSHKLIHLGHLISIKLGLKQIQLLYSGAQILDSNRGLFFEKRWAFIITASSLAAMLFIPLLIVQQEILVWASPVGEEFSWSFQIASGIFLMTVARIWGHSSVSIRALEKLTTKTWLSILTALLIPICLMLLACHWASSMIVVTQLIVLLCLVDFIAQIGIGYVSIRNLTRFIQQKVPLIETLASVKCVKALGHSHACDVTQPQQLQLFKIRYANIWGTSVNQVFAKCLQTDVKNIETLFLGRRNLLLVIKETAALSPIEIYTRLLTVLGAQIEECIKVPEHVFSNSKYGSTVSSYVTDMLLSQKGSELQNSNDPMQDRMFALIKEGSIESIGILRQEFAIQLVTKEEGWDFSRVGIAEQRNEFAEFIRQLIVRDLVCSPIVLWRKSYPGFFHVLQHNSLQIVLRIPVELRTRKSQLERMILMHNFNQLIESESK